MIVQVVGFFDRGRLGEDCYKRAFAALLRRDAGFEVRVSCIDHLHVLPRDTHAVVCAGEVVNDYFMIKLRELLADTAIPCYAMSVGCASAASIASSAAHHLALFDHAVMRSRADAALAAETVGEDNVSYCPDLLFHVDDGGADPNAAPSAGEHTSEKSVPVLGVCPSRPFFFTRNARGDEARAAAFANAVAHAAQCLGGWRVELLGLDASGKVQEDDGALCADLAKRVRDVGVPAQALPRVRDAAGARAAMRGMRAVIVMRYHALVLASLEGRPTFAVYCQPKLHHLLADWGALHGQRGRTAGVRLPHDPTTCLPSWPQSEQSAQSAQSLGARISDGISAQLRRHGPDRPVCGAQPLQRLISIRAESILAHRLLRGGLRKAVRFSQLMRPVSEDARPPDRLSVHERCNESLVRLLHGDAADAAQLKAMVTWYETGAACEEDPHLPPAFRVLHGALPRQLAEDVARLVLYHATGRIDSPYAWGVVERLRDERAVRAAPLRTQMDWVMAEEREKRRRVSACSHSEHAPLLVRPVPNARLLLDLDFLGLAQHDFAGAHRAGWARVQTWTRYLWAHMHGRTRMDARTLLRLDMYVDRTFHWGHAALSASGVLPHPAGARWAGVVHHTFDRSHSDFNCAALFEKRAFLDALPGCVALVALSRYLAEQLRHALRLCGAHHVTVLALAHPAEDVPESRQFSVPRFLSNPRPRVVQIGAWLRNPFAIYDLQLMPAKTSSVPQLRKAALRGRNMDLYFAPADFEERVLRGVWLPPDSRQPGLRDDDMYAHSYFETHSQPSHAHTRNKFLHGAAEALLVKRHSVEQIERLDDDEYDELLASNVVFLQLIDASAVNTLLECVARSTPVFVNRHPAVEETLGADYPGLYDSLAEASVLLGSLDAIRAAHEHLAALPKARFTVETFVRELHDGLVHAVHSYDANLKARPDPALLPHVPSSTSRGKPAESTQ